MEEAEEKMAALKRAYADILLNMAKESAARVVASDRRALRFQQDLFRAKEEAVTTLLRVKGIMDSKVSEAERVSLSQARRIQELEIQLTESEKTVKCLKMELKRVNDELRCMKGSQTESFDKQSMAESHFTVHECICQKALTQRTANGQCFLSFENASQVEPLEDFSAKNHFVSHPVLTSIIMRSKEPELYRNGCTQRIRAFEQSVLTRKVPLGPTDDQFPKNKCFNCGNELTQEPSVNEFPDADNMLTGTKNTDESKDTGQHGGRFERGKVLFQGFSLQRKRTRIKRMLSSVHTASNQVDTGHEPSESPSCNNLGGNTVIEQGKTILQTEGEAPQEMDSHLDPLSNGSSRDSEDGRGRLESCDTENRPSSLKCQNSAHVESVKNGSYLKSDDQIYQGTSSNVDNIEHEAMVRPSQLCSKPDMVPDVFSEGGVRNNGNSILAPEEESRVNQRKAENLDTSITKVQHEKINGHLTNSEFRNGRSVESNGTPLQGTTDRLLKYTFRRKRKRGSSTSVDEGSLPEKNNTSDGRSGGKPNALGETREPILFTGSSRDSRRIAQVARQLISLSEKRW